MPNAEAELETFLARYLPAIAATGRGVIKWLRARLPGCDVLVYDNYQALAVGFSPDGKTGSGIFSVALYPRWVNFFFLQGAGLTDRDELLQGSGSTVRHIRIERPEELDQPAIRALIDQALTAAKVPYDPARSGRLVIKSVSERQRPRRP